MRCLGLHGRVRPSGHDRTHPCPKPDGPEGTPPCDSPAAGGETGTMAGSGPNGDHVRTIRWLTAGQTHRPTLPDTLSDRHS